MHFSPSLVAGFGLCEWGAIIGWPVFMSGAVLAGSGWGALTGEWKGSRGKSRMLMAGGVSLLIVAVAILGMAG